MSRRVVTALVLDVLLVLLFAAIGRASHDEGNVVLGVLGTAWPFLVGTAVGWAVVTLTGRRPPLDVGRGIPVWVCAVAVGMLLRRLVGDGTALSFVIVATIVLGVFLLGWRALDTLRRSRQDRATAS
ncbi:DUF3054 domain-containing protein [Luteipulveratus sp. YIM 133132]|uniref:DUF3054 domain-containing protein n=1 Tax=Luteipulveratus flavus TaxID=3031728 RepID=UPI0023AE928D|nr:DUF3054 domain-containing protein [Luteipulveratus sp. YIM 133132]MDE9367433.1 DUF3054 domain-containing protein [Luteipulveratus sp. YIM 133132]